MSDLHSGGNTGIALVLRTGFQVEILVCGLKCGHAIY